ncbi:hypothetical protein CPB84DRAFT_862119 [Gymnopilus junonius]|uniref:F-box domain-containing protein n=1 Tax=Gymnopilus junonius TaxID=109634 RepID=A0A9P5NML9_GYMJU|nr:hypothetical protein CPB84DRAFT_862119 [Gymnopilus junonius]
MDLGGATSSTGPINNVTSTGTVHPSSQRSMTQAQLYNHANSVGGIESISARSQVLANEDLLDLIFSYFDPAFFEDILTMDSTTKSALLSVCLTCKSFYTPALDLLWRVMNSIIPIFKLIPAFTKVNDTYTLSGVINQYHIARLEMHTRKIRCLHLKTPHDAIPSHILFRFTHLRKFSLFPALTRLHIPSLAVEYLRGIEGLNFLFLAHGKSLSTITLGGINASTDAFTSSFLSALSQECESIQKLTLTGRLTPDTLHFVSEFQHLQTLNLTFDAAIVEVEFIQLCSHLMSLTHFIIHLQASSTVHNPSGVGKGAIHGFDALQELQISAPPPDALRILEVISKAGSVKVISLSCPFFSARDISATALSIKSCIGESCRISPSMSSLTVQMGNNNTVVLPRNSLSPLLACKNLRYFALTGISLAITDDDISQICEEGGWENLTVLWLPPSAPGSSPSLSSLHVLATHCPKIHVLAIPIDFSLDFSNLNDMRLHPRRPHGLQHLTVIRSALNRLHEDSGTTIATAIGVSRFLEYQFPFLCKSVLSGGTGSSDWWNTVKSLMKEYKLIRVEERRKDDDETV